MSINYFKLITKLSMAIAIVIILHYYLFLTNIYWVLLSAILASLPTHGSIMRRGFIILFILFIVVIIMQFFVPIIVHDRMIDVIFGVAIGTFCQLIWPINLVQEFSEDILPVLQQVADYLETSILHFSEKEYSQEWFEKKINLEKMLSKKIAYPEWVFATGFNPGLRGGFRFFLIHLDRIIELLFALTYLLDRFITQHTNQMMRDLIIHSMKVHHEIFNILINYFKHNQLGYFSIDYDSDIATLDKTIWQILPARLEGIDLSEEPLTLLALVRNIKDTRRWLLKLLSALPDE